MGRSTDVGRYINKISNRLKRYSPKIEKKLGLTSVQGKILSFILLEEEETDLCQKDVEREFDLRPSTVTELLGALEKKELICRVSGEFDGRYKIIHATAKARELREELQEEIQRMEDTLTRGISVEELIQFRKTAEKMQRNLEE